MKASNFSDAHKAFIIKQGEDVSVSWAAPFQFSPDLRLRL